MSGGLLLRLGTQTCPNIKKQFPHPIPHQRLKGIFLLLRLCAELFVNTSCTSKDPFMLEESKISCTDAKGAAAAAPFIFFRRNKTLLTVDVSKVFL